MLVSRVLIERVPESVACVCPADGGVYVLVAVAVEVAEGNAMALLQVAKSAIRTYYRKVAQANEIFTDYKPGWKTDRGILYVVYGTPKEVFRSNATETWVYDDELSFEFRILSNLFTPELYVLKRDQRYRESWISRVRVLRGGK